MESIILALMAQAQVTEEKLKTAGTIPLEGGIALSWEYLDYVRTHPVEWSAPTAILYAERDNLQPRKTIEDFADAHGADLTVMPDGEHWFHTEEQMRFLNDSFRKER
jgi:pimeloyl-ACP methyl ester carboxylesterase